MCPRDIIAILKGLLLAKLVTVMDSPDMLNSTTTVNHHESIVKLRNKGEPKTKESLRHRRISTNTSGGVTEHCHFTISSVMVVTGRIINGC